MPIPGPHTAVRPHTGPQSLIANRYSTRRLKHPRVPSIENTVDAAHQSSQPPPPVLVFVPSSLSSLINGWRTMFQFDPGSPGTHILILKWHSESASRDHQKTPEKAELISPTLRSDLFNSTSLISGTATNTGLHLSSQISDVPACHSGISNRSPASRKQPGPLHCQSVRDSLPG